MATADRVQELITPLLAQADLDLYDLELAGGVLRILVDRAGGADIDAISTLARAISRALDEHDPIQGHYTLEVSSPGLERPLRTPAHFAAAVGDTVKVKTVATAEGDRRIEGVVTAADDDAVTIRAADGTERAVAYDHIERARTTFEWGPASHPKQGKKASA
jgi:ribosome maturation factor RimP